MAIQIVEVAALWGQPVTSGAALKMAADEIARIEFWRAPPRWLAVGVRLNIIKNIICIARRFWAIASLRRCVLAYCTFLPDSARTTKQKMLRGNPEQRGGISIRPSPVQLEIASGVENGFERLFDFRADQPIFSMIRRP